MHELFSLQVNINALVCESPVAIKIQGDMLQRRCLSTQGLICIHVSLGNIGCEVRQNQWKNSLQFNNTQSVQYLPIISNVSTAIFPAE